MDIESVPVYRHNLSLTLTPLLAEFAKIHRSAQLHEFRRCWEIWLDNNSPLIEQEKMRLKEAGYTGDVAEKMYKSVRYYLRGKPDTPKTPKKRRKYYSFDGAILADMDRHIMEVALPGRLKPSHAYNNFWGLSLRNNRLSLEQRRLRVAGLSEKEVEHKIKKTYKNRLFILQRKS